MSFWVRLVKFATLLNIFICIQWSLLWIAHELADDPMLKVIDMDELSSYGVDRCNEYAYSPRQGFAKMRSKLFSNLFGQSLVSETVIESMKKQHLCLGAGVPIIFEFYGPSGTGKSYVCELIAESVYMEGVKSPLVHIFDGEDINVPEDRLPVYVDEQKKWMTGNVTECKKAMYIFLHTEKIPQQLLDAVHDVLQSNKGGIFLFTNTEMSPIIPRLYAHQLRQGLMKKDMHPQLFKPVFRKTLFNKRRRVIFLPMEEKDLKSCMFQEFEKKGYLLPNNCMIMKIYERIHMDTFGYTNITCKDITKIVNDIMLFGKC